MINKTGKWFADRASAKTIIPFILCFIIGQGILTTCSKHLNQLAGKELTVPDLQPFFTAEQAKATLDAMGEEGRAFYFRVLIYADFVLPVLFSLCFTFLWAYALKDREKWLWICLIPLVATVLDFIENAMLIHMLMSYPDASHGGVVTGLKVICIAISCLGALAALGKWLINLKQ